MLTTGNLPEISLYFHIPFCTRKCGYCHFYVLPDQESNKDALLQGFQLEWERWLPFLVNKKIATIYFGGGTPSLFGPARIAAILRLIQSTIPSYFPQIEITLEANPENIHVNLMKEYSEAGINRVSIGVQTLDDDLLQLLGRLHKAEAAVKAVHETYQAGIQNISIDLMYDLPNQTLDHWHHTLNAVQQLPIRHLSLYNLTIEPHTLFFKKQEILSKLIPDEETSLAMYERAIDRLEKFGLQRYEISAFAKPGFHSHHNVGYWTARSFLGFGPSAFSYWEGKRFRNVANLNRYCKDLIAGRSPIDFEEQLDLEAHRRELFVIKVRLREGVCLSEFEALHGPLDTSFKQTLKNLIQDQLIEAVCDSYRLTRRGILFYDHVAAELI